MDLLDKQSLIQVLQEGHFELNGNTVSLLCEAKPTQIALADARTHAVLSPLKDNPLNQKSHFGGFSVHISESHPYFHQHADWCKEIENRVPSIRDAKPYVERIKKCKAALGIPDGDAELSDPEIENFEKIDCALHKILEEISKKKLEEAVIHGSILFVQECVYQLITLPIKEAQNYLKDNLYIFVSNQTYFRKELKKLFMIPNKGFY